MAKKTKSSASKSSTHGAKVKEDSSATAKVKTGKAVKGKGKEVSAEPSVEVSSVAVSVSSASAVVNTAIATVDTSASSDEVVLTDAEGRRYCRATDCDQVGMVDGYCRYHYLYFWKKIQVRKKILADGKLERYIDELTARYTDKFIELLRKDLRTEKDFLAAVQELELDDSASSSPQDEDEAKSYLEEISGVASESSSRDDDGY